MSKSKSGKSPPKDFDNSKRAFFRGLVKPFMSAVNGYELPPDHSSTNPPQKRKVIHGGGSNARVLGLLGPLARGEQAAGYRLYGVSIAEDRIDVSFEQAGRFVKIRMAALDATEGAAFAQTHSFRLVVDGDAPESDRAAVGERLRREVAARDQGQLWVVAADAPPPRDQPERPSPESTKKPPGVASSPGSGPAAASDPAKTG